MYEVAKDADVDLPGAGGLTLTHWHERRHGGWAGVVEVARGRGRLAPGEQQTGNPLMRGGSAQTVMRLSWPTGAG